MLTRATYKTNYVLPNEERRECFHKAFDRLDENDQSDILDIHTRLVKIGGQGRYHPIGEEGAMEIIACLGMWIAQHPEWVHIMLKKG